MNKKINQPYCAKLSLAVILFLLVTKTFAQNEKANSAYSFSMQQCVDYALQNHLSIQNATNDELIAKNKVNEVVTIGLPHINGGIDVKDFIHLPTTLIPSEAFGGPKGQYIAAQFGIQYNASADLTLTQLIFDGTYLVGLQSTKVYMELSKKNTQRTKIEVAAAIYKAYYSVIVNEERMKLIDANIERLKKLLDDTKAMNQNGFVEKNDVDRISVAYNNILVEKTKVERLMSLSNALLKFQMGMPQSSQLTTTDKISSITYTAPIIQDKTDYTRRIEYSLFQTQYQAAKLLHKQNKMTALPSLAFYGTASAQAFRPEFNFFDGSKKWYPMGLIGAKLNVPIFSSGQLHFKMQQSKLEILKAENNLKQMEQNIELEIISTKTILENANNSLETQKKNIELAEQIYNSSKVKYQQGVGSNLEVMSAETALKEAQTNYYNALYDALISKTDYDKANGTLIK